MEYSGVYLTSEEQGSDPLFEAIAPSIQIIRLQLAKHKLRESSPSRAALEKIYVILRQRFHKLRGPSYEVSWWWLQDAMYMSSTLRDAVRRIQRPLSSTDIDALQTLGDYVVKWYSPDGLGAAATIYCRILIQIDSRPSYLQDERRPHVVKELAKAYVDPALSRERFEGQHSIILQGLSEIRKGDHYDIVQFYHHLGAWYLHEDGKSMELKSRVNLGEEILRRTHEMQVQLFGAEDYRPVKTVDILSKYYIQEAREVEAASLLESVLRPHKISGNALIDAPVGSGDKRDNFGDDEDDDDGGEFERAGDERKRQALKECKDSLKGSGLTDNFDARLRSLLAPPSFVWKDSQIYLCDIDNIRWQKVVLTETLENYPLCMVVRNCKVELRVPMATILPNGEESAQVGAAATDHELAHNNARDLLGSHASSYLQKLRSRTEPQETKPNLTTPDIETRLWVFPRELMESEWQTPQHRENLGQRAPDQTYVQPVYQYRKLPGPEEWVVTVTYSAKPEWPMFTGQQEQLPFLGPARPGSVPRIDNLAHTWLFRNDLEYTIQQKLDEDSSISLVCPFICYKEVRKLRGFGWGFKYAEFMQQLRLSVRHSGQREAIMGFKAALCRNSNMHLPKPKLTNIVYQNVCNHVSGGTNDLEMNVSEKHHESAGFFNHIPGLSLLIHPGDRWHGFNLVSSIWADWETFVVNDDLPKNGYPRLESEDGELMNCRGIIRGRWMPSNLEGYYPVEEVYVVDAVFNSTQEPDTQWDFIFSAGHLDDTSKTPMSAAEKRLLMGSLNPSFFDYIDPYTRQFLSGGSFFHRDKTSAPKELTFNEKLMLKAMERKKEFDLLNEKKKQWKDDPRKMAEIEREIRICEEKWEQFDKDLASTKNKLLLANIVEEKKL
ncbi:hypothetical protein CNYM01_10716 [Colletotrichum nymphaeae SA-01]|uniref:Uncharacterized protein n=1 Tax=Colletotrichum nymphaeae SA-01 TaxID=1460502 RepID=A0A135U8C0_9PEZI|nr:hypothetical protein CNYM01_10716 [Colletotrichum nymphaeae SA-01]